ncbi:hydrogenase expression/formation protein HypE [Rubeoparvulum massiliense]|uniref:hydrogenase expression/formation protein HypE n=1 Tax=Rubeoparvulum massiliense TaxID=1631346 RepID=UPI00065E1E53|nr:hydrogenase expression/formation protein HypE [Rubeoparvulum massiliense]
MEVISMAHGDGGEQAHRLIDEIFVQAFGHAKEATFDAAQVPVSAEIAITTDSFVIQPLFFPGGNIGKLAVAGTVNDLAVSGAIPQYLTAAFILEEGFPIADLKKIVQGMAEEAHHAGVRIVAGDTKVVARGQADGCFINTTGIGIYPQGNPLTLAEMTAGDKVIISGTLGDHGVAILSARGDLGFTSEVVSDCATLNGMLSQVLEEAPGAVRIMRDPTRGGLATTLVEIAEDHGATITIEERKIPVHPAVAGACDLLGYDPLYLANEGKVLLVVKAEQVEQVMEVLKQHPEGKNATLIGEVNETGVENGRLLLRTPLGSTRRLERLLGMHLPRIC